jgi:hypothetical protein
MGSLSSGHALRIRLGRQVHSSRAGGDGPGRGWLERPGAGQGQEQEREQADGERGRRVRTGRCSRCLLLDGRAPLRWSGRPKEFKRLEAAAGARLALGEQYGLGGAGVRVLSQRGKAKEGLGKVKRAAGKYILLWPGSSLEPWMLEWTALEWTACRGYGGARATVGCAWGRELTTLAFAESLIGGSCCALVAVGAADAPECRLPLRASACLCPRRCAVSLDTAGDAVHADSG